MTIVATSWLAASLILGSPIALQNAELKALEGEGIFVDDRTPGRPLESVNPPMSSKFSIRVEPDAVILVDGHGSGNKNVRVALNGSHTDVPGATAGAFARYTGGWKDGAFSYEVSFVRGAGQAPGNTIKRDFRITADGLVVNSNLELTPGVSSVGLYKQAKDIPMPTPFKAVISDISWLAGNWSGVRGTGGTISFEERWSPPKGGSMFATARTVNRERLTAFEFLRIVEKDGGLVYVAQPNGGAPTEFVLTELTAKKAVFDNPRHDYPKRIVYELSEGGLTATIGYLRGGTPRRFEFKRE